MKIATLCLTAGLALFAASNAAAEDAPVADGGRSARLQKDYKVDDARVDGLRERKLGYGEISHVLGIAETMPGGITDANVDAIMALRAGPPVMGWGQIAKKQGTTLGKIRGGADAPGKSAKPEKAGKPEKGARPERAARPEKAARAEKPAKPARGGR